MQNFNVIKTCLKKIWNTNNYSRISSAKVQSINVKSLAAKTFDDIVSPIEKPTLTDTFGRNHTYLRISLSEKCNLRCTYCMPADGVKLTPQSQVLSSEEILYLAQLFVAQGVRKIRLTGGEPTVRKDIVNIIEKLKLIPNLEQVGITTNGLVLTKLLVPMQKAGLDAINISLDTLKSKKYEEITRRKGYERVIAGIDLAIQLGYKPKINCVLMKNFNDDEICDFIEFTKDRNVDLRFIEYMPFTGNKWQTDKMISFKDTLKIINEKWPNFQALPNGPNDTSKAYSVPGYDGQVGFITSMTEHFCGTCNRLRLTADGNLKVCLFGNTEISLRDAIRNKLSEDELVSIISSAVKRKKKQHADFYRTKGTAKTLNLKSNYSDEITTILANSFLDKIHPTTKRFYSSSNVKSSQISKNLIEEKKNDIAISKNPSQFTHVDAEGKSKMVDVSNKEITKRLAKAEATVEVGPEIAKLIYENSIAKGDVLSVAQVAGILGAKKTSDLIPLCHNIYLSSVKLHLELNLKKNEVIISSTVCCDGKTGVEMEALTSVSIAALTVYDMCKAISHKIKIQNIHLIEKTGGKNTFLKESNILSIQQDNAIFQKKSFGGPLPEEQFYPLYV